MFVALKNGEHDGNGYLFVNGEIIKYFKNLDQIKITEIKNNIKSFLLINLMNKFLIKLPNDSVYISILLVPILAIFSIFLLETVLLFVTARFYIKFIEIKNFYYFNNFFF